MSLCVGIDTQPQCRLSLNRRPPMRYTANEISTIDIHEINKNL